MFQIRDYVPGDSQRQIHWKLSHKYDKLIVKDPSLPITRSAAVFWERTEETPLPPAPTRKPRLSSPSAGTFFPSPCNSRSAGTRNPRAAVFSSKFATWTTSSACFRACLRRKRRQASAARRFCCRRCPPEAGRI
ncbi:MAG: DUF58 domain-containing protein [Acutalibacteraceae bacterium]